MTYKVNKAVVIGAGTMGAALAAHLANAGVSVTLLDIVPKDVPPEAGKTARNKIVNEGFKQRKNPAQPVSSLQINTPWLKQETWKMILMLLQTQIG